MAESISLNYYKHIHSSDWFYPSNCELRPLESKGSITQTLTHHNIDLFARTTIHHNIFAKGLRALARAVALLVIGVIVAPIDILRHGCYAIIYTLAEGITSGKVKKSAEGLFDNFRLFLISGAFATLSSFSFLLNTMLLTNFSSKNINDSITVLIGIVVFFTIGLAVVSVLSSPGYSINYFVNPDKSLPLYKSIVIRSDFGIVNKDGGLLPSDPTDDETLNPPEGYLYNWMTQKKDGLDRTYLASELHSPGAGGFNSYKSLFLAKLSSPESLQDPNAQRLRKLYGQLLEISNFFVDCLDVKFPQSNTIQLRKTLIYEFDRIPVAFPIQDPSWDATVEQATECHKNLPPLSEKLPELAKMVDIIRKNGTPQELLDNPTAENLGENYRIKTHIVHPDKLDLILKTIEADAPTKAIILSQAKEVLACLQKAKKVVKKSFNSQS